MRSPAGIIGLVSVGFIFLGATWFGFIQKRCEEIFPRPVLSQAVNTATTSTAGTKMVRSPHAKFYHDALFWTISILEVFVSVLYIATGIFLLKRFVLARWVCSLTLSLHMLLLILIVGFMKYGAMPLSALTHNPNMLELYFWPSSKTHNVFLVWVNGFRFFLPDSLGYFLVVLLYFCFCFLIFSRLEVKRYLSPAKNI